MLLGDVVCIGGTQSPLSLQDITLLPFVPLRNKQYADLWWSLAFRHSVQTRTSDNTAAVKHRLQCDGGWIWFRFDIWIRYFRNCVCVCVCAICCIATARFRICVCSICPNNVTDTKFLRSTLRDCIVTTAGQRKRSAVLFSARNSVGT